MARFEMTDLGKLHYFLGLEVKQMKDGIFISQKKYSIDLLKRFNMLNCKGTRTPMNVNKKLQQEDGSRKTDEKNSRSLVKGFIYLIDTQPNNSFFYWYSIKVYELSYKASFWSCRKDFVISCRNFGVWYLVHTSNKLQVNWFQGKVTR